MRAKFIRGQEPKTAMGIGLARELADKTSDAYSFSRYGMDSWTEIASLMLDQGSSEDVVEWVLRSKHMRWAADHMPDFNEEIGLAGFEYYLKRNTNDIQKDLVNPDLLK
jgi:hypothetical protein